MSSPRSWPVTSEGYGRCSASRSSSPPVVFARGTVDEARGRTGEVSAVRVSRGERGRAPCARSPSRTRPLRAATGPRRSRDRSDARGAGFRASQALRSERAGSRRGTHLAVDLDRLQGRPRAILGLARARREVHRDEARVSVARTGAARKEGEPRSARGSRSAAKKMPHVDGIGQADTSQNSVGRCDVAVYVSGGNNEARTLHVRASTQRARVT